MPISKGDKTPVFGYIVEVGLAAQNLRCTDRTEIVR